MKKQFALFVVALPATVLAASAWFGGCSASSSDGPSANACVPSTEICNLQDDDCDGYIDEDDNGMKMTRECKNSCGAGIQTCNDGQWSACDAPNAKKETCNGKDDDCDGVTDNGFDCAAGSEKECGTDVGACRKGVRTCNANCGWGSCEGDIEPESKEICGNDKDDNCDGQTDEGCSCKEGETKTCCGGSQVTCTSKGKFPACPAPPQEVCNGKDDDCDGVTDNHLPDDPYRTDEGSKNNDTCAAAYNIPDPILQKHPAKAKKFTFYLNKADDSVDKDFITFSTKEYTDTSCPDGQYECYTLTVEVTDPKDSDVEFCLYEVGQPGASPNCAGAANKWCSGQGGNPKNKVVINYEGGCDAFNDDGKQYVAEISLASGAPKTCNPYELAVTFAGSYPQVEKCSF